MDWFSNLPPGIPENILCFLPIQEAVRTSILSREWRYRWIKIPKLEFEEVKFHVSTDGAELSNGADLEQMSGQTRRRKDLITRRKFFYAICQVLLMHEGPLHEFTLSMRSCDGNFLDDELVEIDSITFHLSRKNTIKKLAIDNEWGWYKLPFSLFSFHQLADLCLSGCAFSHLPTFKVGSLTSLSLNAVHITIKELLHLLSNCPSLKTMTLVNEMYMESGYPTVSDNPAMFDLFGCLPVIESLSIPFAIFQWFKSCVHHKFPRELPIRLNHLKYLCLYEVCFTRKDGLSILVLFMKSSPKLEKIEIDNIYFEEGNSSEEDNLLTEDDLLSFTLSDYSDIWLEHMSELHITSRLIFGSELNFVKLILAKSPVLKKVTIKLDYRKFDEDEELQILKVLLSSPRASPVVEIIV